jgi:preprotein translocase subunit YajC
VGAAPAVAPGGTTTPPPAPGAAPKVDDGGFFGAMGGIPLLLLMFAAMWFLLIRPQQKREKEIRKKQAELKKGDSVVTNAGIFGEIVKIDGDRISVRVSENTTIVFQRGAITSVAEGKDNATAIASK